ncbi:MAG: hypothetical protein AB2L24_31050 [Mangrovibacterium sp.]
MIKETEEGLKIVTGKDGYEALFINSSRIDDCINFLTENNYKSITVNSFQGYSLKDLNFLDKLKDLVESIVIGENHYDISIINTLHKLRYLGIADNKKDVIDLSNFPELETLACDFSDRLKGLESANKLRSLTISNYKSKNKNLLGFPALLSLEHLNLVKPDINSLQGIEKFTKLKRLEIYGASKLDDIGDVSNLKSLEQISIEKSKNIKDYEALKDLSNLKKLMLTESGDIKTLAFVKSLPYLEFISFWGTNVLDGNISYCEGIDYVGFDNKKHYSHKSEQFKK